MASIGMTALPPPWIVLLAVNSTNVFEFSAAPTNDRIVVSTAGGLTIAGGGFLLYTNGTTGTWAEDGVYNLIQYSGAVTGNVSSLQVLNPSAGKTYTFSTNGTYVTLTISHAAMWDGGSGADSNWQTPENWADDVAPAAYASLRFGGPLRLVNTNDFAVNTRFGSLTFDSSAGAFTLAVTIDPQPLPLRQK
jgi:hypothetical protein